MTKLLTIKEYADQEKVGIEAIRMRIRRGTCFTKWKGDTQYVFVEKDKTIKKPRGARLRPGEKENRKLMEWLYKNYLFLDSIEDLLDEYYNQNQKP